MLEKTVEVSNVTLGASKRNIRNFYISFRNKEYLQMQWFDPPFSQVKTVEVSNVPLGASEQDIREFFQFCGDIEYVEMQSDNELTQIAYVTFMDSRGAKIAAHRSGATMIDLVVTVTLKPNYMLPPAASEPFERVDHCALPTDETAPGSEDAVGEAGDVVSSILATGQTLNGAITSLIATVLEAQEELSEVIKAVREVSEKTKERVGEAEEEQKGKAVNGYAQVSRVEKAVGEVNRKTEERVVEAEEEQKGKAVDGYAQVSKAEKEVGEVSRKTEERVAGAEEKRKGKAVDGYAQVSKVEKAVGEGSRKTEEKVGEAEKERERKAVDGYAQLLSESPKAPAPSEPGASMLAKRRRLNRPAGWEKKNLRR